jgi:hypothetical protein
MIESAGGLLIVERFAVEQLPHTFTPRDVLNRYRGFEGRAWPGTLGDDIALVGGLAPLSEFDRLWEYCRRVETPLIDLVYCSFDEDPDLPDFEFVGFDVGYYESEYNHYSVVLNEVIYGSCDVLTAFNPELNGQLLIDTEKRAEALLAVRATVSRSECDLESGPERLQSISIFVPRPSSRE